MVFVNTKREGERVWGYLEGNGVHAAMLSGDVPQKKRLSLLHQFKSGELPVMVATDVAARGLHIPGVSHVINYDLPDDAEDYVHRIGRTARAGEAGDAISFVCETYAFCLPDIEAYIGMKIPVGDVTSDMLAEVDPRSRVPAPRRPRERRGEGRGEQRGERRGGRREPGGESHRGRGPRGQRGGPEGQREGTGQEPQGQAPAPAQAASDAEDKPNKRRRRRRKPTTDSAPAT
jgi:ATP-dependent RNA helicase RhlB